MAQSRVYKVGTVYSRIKGLLLSGALKSDEKPLWYVVYESFPPKYEPKFDRELPYVPIKKIFYKEDVLRSRFHKEYPNYSDGNMLDSNPTTTQLFLQICAKLQMEQVPENQIYLRALRELPKYDSKFTLSKESDQENN